MATSSSPLRLDPDLTDAARTSAASMSRSLAQQIAHWARIGRELERSPGVTIASVKAVLEGSGEYDALNSHEQAIVRATWAERIDDARKHLRLDQTLTAQGREIVEFSQAGQVSVRKPRSRSGIRRVK